MKEKTRQTTSSKNFRKPTKLEEETKRAFMKYHPIENNPLFKVDDNYKMRLSFLLGVEVV